MCTKFNMSIVPYYCNDLLHVHHGCVEGLVACASFMQGCVEGLDSPCLSPDYMEHTAALEKPQNPLL